jgi:polyhydroxybutyrate depolymerase
MTKRLVLCAVSIAICNFPAIAQSKAERKMMTFTVDGVARKAIVAMPAKQNGPLPVVLAFHGHGDTNGNFSEVQLQEAWPEAIVVYPQGLPSSRDGLSGWQTEPGMDKDRDLKLVDEALTSLHKAFKIDDARVYATGFSNGGHFSYLLWAERPQVFAAFAPVAGRIRNAIPKQPKPLLHIGGNNDRQVDFADQMEAMDTARKVNGVAAKGDRCQTIIPTGACMMFASASGTPVMTVVFIGSHEYPYGTSQQIVKFFQQYRLEPVKSAAR